MTKKINKTGINNLAKTVKEYIEKNHKLPSTVTVNNIKYTWPEIWYILSWAINNLNKDLDNVPNVKACTAPTGESINEKIYPGDYKDQAKRIVQYIKQHGQAPNYVTSVKSKKKVAPRVSIDAISRIVVWYNNNHILPGYCTYDSSRFSSTTKKTTKKSKYGHSTAHGCDNMGQNNSVNCGPHTLQEIIRNLTGKVIPQSQLAAWAGTGSGGTDHKGLETAIAMAAKKIGVKLTVKWYNFSELGWSGIKKIIASTNQDIGIHNLYRNKYGHYETVDSISDSYCKVHNSLGDKCSKGCYCGYIESRSLSEFRSYIAGISQKSIFVVTRG